MKLNPIQREAVRHPNHLALTSCPGSGKTRTLVAKLLETLDEVRDSTRLIACLTYTNTAVYEIESRLLHAGGMAAALCEVETIHTFCLKHIVAPHSWRLRAFRDGFSVIAPDDPLFVTIVSQVIPQFGLERRAAGDFEQLARGTGVYPDTIGPDAAEAFWSELDARRLMDFSSIIFWARRLCQDIAYVARGLASRYAWILVDEFQDTSVLQTDILRAIFAHGRTKFFLVGDPFQSIMSFAGARPELLSAFGTEIGARCDLKLLSNYRSSKNILVLADALCPRDQPMMAEGDDRGHLYSPQWHAVSSMLDGVLSIFIPELQQQRIELSNAVLLANRWTSLLPLSRGLRNVDVPVIGPGARPYRRSNHVIAALVEEVAAQIAEPDARGAAQVKRELRRLIHTITGAAQVDLGFAGDVCAIRLVRTLQGRGDPEAPAGEFLRQFAVVVTEALVSDGFVSVEEGKLIAASAEAMLLDIVSHEAMHRVRTTTVRHLGLFARGSNSLRLMTMHGAKGREFDAVGIVDLFDGHVPFFRAQAGDEIEDEGRRLLYVALTRARKVLMIFTLATTNERTRPSRFLPMIFPKSHG